MTPIWAWARRELAPASARRARARAPDRRERRGGPHDRRRRSAHRIGLRAVPGGEQHRRRPAAVRLRATDDSTTRSSTRSRADPDVEQAAPLYITVGVRRGDATTTSASSPGRTRRCSPRSTCPRILEGRRPDPSDPHEVADQPLHAGDLGVEVGDTVTVGTFAAEQFDERRRRLRGPRRARRSRSRSSGIARDPVRPRRSGVQRRSTAHRPSTRSTGRRRRLRAHHRDRRRPGPRPDGGRRPRRRRLRPRGGLRQRAARPGRQGRGRHRVLAVGLAAFAAVAGLARSWSSRAGPPPPDGARRADDLPASRDGVEPSASAPSRSRLSRRCPSSSPAPCSPSLLASRARRSMPIGQAAQAEPPGVDVDAARARVGALLLVAPARRDQRPARSHARRRRIGLAAVALAAARRPAASAARQRPLLARRASSASRWPSTRAQGRTRSRCGRRSSARRSGWRGRRGA